MIAQEVVTGYSDILQKLESIEPVKYARTRNFLDGAVTHLSPYISRGVLSLNQVKSFLMERFSKKESMKYINELAWREYFQREWEQLDEFIFEDIKRNQVHVKTRNMIKALAEGKTGIRKVDEHILGMAETGYMHNHMRMFVASIACNIAHAHWLKPSQWMYYHLLDGDIASNALSWQWVAGTFSSRKYLANQENINYYTRDDQRNTFLDKSYEALMIAETPVELSESCSLELRTILPPSDIFKIDPSKPLLLYNSYNLNPEWHKGEDVNRVLVLEPSHFEKFPVSEKVIRFILGLKNNIPGIQLFTGEVASLPLIRKCKKILSKTHQAFKHYPGEKEKHEWMFEVEEKYYSSHSAYWKECEKIYWQQ